ncbi:peptidase family M3 [Byssothecium circinans]|uniref:Peptidase family M3 n=1 Tax=Byssothecium circinans TaxID=147558 RepID=A0A6A5U2C7_9PLEO|nr:peptidase family M3 [Byssothecium circinans]
MASLGRLSLAALLCVPAVLAAFPKPHTPEAYEHSSLRFSYHSKRQSQANLTHPPQTPPVFNDTASLLVSDAEAICNQTKAVLDKLAATVSPLNATFNNTYRPILNDEHEALLRQYIQGFYAYVSTDTALQDASNEASAIQSNCALEAGTRDDIFKLVEGVYNRLNATYIDAEDKYLVNKDYKAYLRNGLALEGATRDKFKTVRSRITDLQLAFDKNYAADISIIWLTPAELEGLPADHIGSLAKGTGENEGKVGLTFKAPDFSPAMSLVKNPDVRRRIYIGQQTRVKENVPIMKEAIVKRDEAARILGYPHHAALALENKMAHDVATVQPFLEGLRDRLYARGQEEIAEMNAIKKTDHESRNLTYDGNFYSWDRDYYNNIVINTKYAVDQVKVSEYFPLDHTISAMLHVFESLFSLHFVQLSAADLAALSPSGNAKEMTWHDDVIAFAVWEGDDSGFVGYLYMDLYPRDGKYSHFAEFTLQPGFLKSDGKRHYPAAALVCNFPKPQGSNPALMTHDDVVTFFHELGHGIHELSGRTKWGRLSGTSTARDFVEAPSQMLENWMWTNLTLSQLSSHYKTNESLPTELMDALISTKHVMEGLLTLRQLAFGLFDMKIHTPATHADVEAMDLNLEYTKAMRNTTGLKGPEDQGEPENWSNGEATFSHLMGGYDAGYYGYLWSQVYSTDMFYTAFKADPMNPTTGNKYRHQVLEKGGSQDEFLTLEQFLGRPPNSEAFYKELGLETRR